MRGLVLNRTPMRDSANPGSRLAHLNAVRRAHSGRIPGLKPVAERKNHRVALNRRPGGNPRSRGTSSPDARQKSGVAHPSDRLSDALTKNLGEHAELSRET